MSRAARHVSLALAALLVASVSYAAPKDGPGSDSYVLWRELGAPARTGGAMVWDSRRGRALLFGGDGAAGQPFATPWQLLRTPHPRWEPLVTTLDGPPYRSGYSAVYDSLRDRVLLFGGRSVNDGSGSNELWQLRLDEPVRWLQLEFAPGPAPPPRYDATMILDRDNRLVLFGGDGLAFQDSALWILPLDGPALRWQELEGYELGQGPGPRTRHSAAYSPAANLMLVFGGEAKLYAPLLGLYGYETRPPRTWALSLGNPVHWVAALADPAAEGPIAEVGGALVADDAGRYAWLIPGYQGYDATSDPTDWRYDFSELRWTRGHPGFGGPGPRGGIAACMDRGTGDVIVHGGATPFGYDQGLASDPLAETWTLTTVATPGWLGISRMPGLVDRPWRDPRAHFDAQRRQLVTWTREGVWICDAAGDGTWHLQPVSPGEGPQYDDAMSTIDPVRRRLLVFGGLELVGERYENRDGDRLWTWPLDGAGVWSSTHIDGAVPSNIYGTQCGFDEARDRVIALPSARSYPDRAPLDTLATIEFAGGGARWASMPVAGAPPRPRSDGTVMMDPVHDRLILQGGRVDDNIDGSHARDLWALSLSGPPRWELQFFHPFDVDVVARCGLAIDPTLGRFLLIGGQGLTYFGFGQCNSVRAASFDDPTAWSDLDPGHQSPMSGAGPLFFDAAADRMLWWNGRQLWEITWPFGTPSPYGLASVSADAGGVHIRWPGEPTLFNYVAAIDRSMDGGRTWARLRSVAPEYDGTLAFTDADASASGSRTYRATIQRAGATITLGTASTVLGSATVSTLTLAAPRPNPARDDVTLELGTPSGGTVTFELFDVSGRLAAPAVRRTVTAGVSVVTVPLARGLSPGLYMLRASDGSRQVERRLAVFR